MKNAICFLVLGLGLMAALPEARAQAVPNGDFETWAPRAGAEVPTGWLTTDDLVTAAFGLALPTGTITKSSTAHGGTAAVRLETKATLFGALPGAVGVGTRVGRDITLPGGIPFTGRPAQLQFYYQLSGPQPPLASNGAFAQIALTRTVGGVPQPIAVAKQVLTAGTGGYVLAQVPLTYSSSATPDTLRLVFSSGAIPSAAGGAPTVGTVLQVDDVTFTGTVTATGSATRDAALTVFPNPSADGRFVRAAPPDWLAAPLCVVDATGRVVRREAAAAPGAPTRALNLTGLPRGLYTLHLLAGEGVVTKKLVIY
jgi:hypothetical protein